MFLRSHFIDVPTIRLHGLHKVHNVFFCFFPLLFYLMCLLRAPLSRFVDGAKTVEKKEKMIPTQFSYIFYCLLIIMRAFYSSQLSHNLLYFLWIVFAIEWNKYIHHIIINGNWRRKLAGVKQNGMKMIMNVCIMIILIMHRKNGFVCTATVICWAAAWRATHTHTHRRIKFEDSKCLFAVCQLVCTIYYMAHNKRKLYGLFISNVCAHCTLHMFIVILNVHNAAHSNQWLLPATTADNKVTSWLTHIFDAYKLIPTRIRWRRRRRQGRRMRIKEMNSLGSLLFDENNCA